LSGLPTPVSAGSTTVDLANRMDEKPGSRNRNLPDVEDALGWVWESAAGLNSRPASPAAGISADTSLVAESEREWVLPGLPTWVANVWTGCSPPEASIKRFSADHLASACSEGDYYPSRNSLLNKERGIWLQRITIYPNPSSRS